MNGSALPQLVFMVLIAHTGELPSGLYPLCLQVIKREFLLPFFNLFYTRYKRLFKCRLKF